MNCGSDCGKNWRHLISGEPQDPGSNSDANLGHPEKRAVRFNPLQKPPLKTKTYLRTAQARPSGFLPALILPVTDKDFRSMTTI